MIELNGLSYTNLSYDENIQFISFKNFIKIFYKFRDDASKYVDMTINELLV